MAYEYKPKTDEEQEQQNSGGAQSVSATNQSVVDSGSSAPSTGSAAAPKPSSNSGNFTNLQSYIEANKNSDFGDKFAGKVSDTATAANTAQGAARNSVEKQVDDNTTKWNPDLVNGAIADPSNYLKGQTPQPKASSSSNDGVYGDQLNTQKQQTNTVGIPEKQQGKDVLTLGAATAPAANPTQPLTDFTKQRDAQYTGPTDFAHTNDYASTFGVTKNAVDTGELSKSGQGRESLLNQFYGRPDYNDGMKRFDNMLLQNDPNNQQALQTAQGKTAATKTGFDSLANQLDAYAKQGATDTATTRANTHAALGLQDDNSIKGGAIGNLDSDLDKAVQTKKDSEAPLLASLQNALGNQDLSSLPANVRESLGLNSLDSIYNLDLTKYLQSASPESINRSSVASQDQYNRLQGLSQLAGVANPLIAGQVGSMNMPVQFQRDNFDRDAATRKADLTKQAYEDHTIDFDNQGPDAHWGSPEMDAMVKDGKLTYPQAQALENSFLNSDQYYIPQNGSASEIAAATAHKAEAKAWYDDKFSKPFQDFADSLGLNNKIKK